ncbi:MAG: IS66 family insertion sequence element accessory protein TnpB [Oscillospiraceae bacterium]|nr:IS66 family insertion sequence element accessory protein TnpB [Oscillospiraceae bacterium]
MLNEFTGADRVCTACGYTNLRKGIDGLASLVQQQFQLAPFTNTLFLFCGKRRDRIKGLYWEKMQAGLRSSRRSTHQKAAAIYNRRKPTFNM